MFVKKYFLYFLTMIIFGSSLQSCATSAPGGYGSGGNGIARHRSCGARPAQNERSYVKYSNKKKKKTSKKKNQKNKKKTTKRAKK